MADIPIVPTQHPVLLEQWNLEGYNVLKCVVKKYLIVLGKRLLV